jgi:hypothetical protein
MQEVTSHTVDSTKKFVEDVKSSEQKISEYIGNEVRLNQQLELLGHHEVT